jgi:hypothetical protein
MGVGGSSLRLSDQKKLGAVNEERGGGGGSMPEMGRSQSPTPSEATSHHSAFGPYNNNTNNNAVGLGMGGMGGMGGSMISDKYPDNVSVVDVFESITSRTNFWCIQISKSPSIFQAYTRAFVLTRSVFKHLPPHTPHR